MKKKFKVIKKIIYIYHTLSTKLYYKIFFEDDFVLITTNNLSSNNFIINWESSSAIND